MKGRPVKVEEIRALIAAATPGPWKAIEFGVHAGCVAIAGRGFLDDGVYCDPPDARFIAVARTLLPLLVDVAEAAFRVHEFDDSPRPDAQLQMDDAMFDLGAARLAFERVSLDAADV